MPHISSAFSELSWNNHSWLAGRSCCQSCKLWRPPRRQKVLEASSANTKAFVANTKAFVCAEAGHGNNMSGQEHWLAAWGRQAGRIRVWYLGAAGRGWGPEGCTCARLRAGWSPGHGDVLKGATTDTDPPEGCNFVTAAWETRGKRGRLVRDFSPQREKRGDGKSTHHTTVDQDPGSQELRGFCAA